MGLISPFSFQTFDLPSPNDKPTSSPNTNQNKPSLQSPPTRNHTKLQRGHQKNLRPQSPASTINMDGDALAKAFVEHYYTTFDTNRPALVNLYQEGSMLTFEGQKLQGPQNILAKLTSLPFEQCKHSISTVDCQPSGPANGMLVFVSGVLQLAGEQHPLKFSQMFHLMPTPQGSFYVFNDIFRLNYA